MPQSKAQLPAVVAQSYKSLVDIELGVLSDYISSVTNFWEAEAARVKKGGEHLSLYLDEGREEVADAYYEELYEVSETLPQVLRTSSVVALYSLLEISLDRLCDLFHAHTSLSLTLDDMSGAGVIRARNYLNKVVLMDFPAGHHLWSDFNKHNRVRNNLVHSGGRVDPNKHSRLISFAESDPHLEIHSGHLYVAEDYVSALRDYVKSVLDHVAATVIAEHKRP